MAKFNQQNQQVTKQVNVGGNATFGTTPNSDSPPAETPQPPAPLPSVSGHADVGQVSGGSVYGTYIGVMNVHNAPSPGVGPVTHPGPPPAAPTADATHTPRLFVSYAHKDAKWLEEFKVQIKPYVRNLQFHAWTDQDLKPGDKWEDVIGAQMANADIGVLLVTPAFLASDFIFENELPALLQKKVFWIAVRASAYQQTPLAALQCANDPARPLASLSSAERDSVWVTICSKLKAMFADPS